MTEAKEDSRPARKAKEIVAEAMDRTRGAVNDRLETAREKFHDVAEDVGERVRKAREVAREKYAVTADQLRDGYTRVQKNVDNLVDDVSEYVRDNPGKSVLIAAGAGFLIGMLMRRRRD